MKSRFTKAVAAILIIIAVLPAISLVSAQDINLSYKLLDKEGNNAAYTLNIVVPQNLLEYYQQKNHQIYSSNYFASFVTPYALKPIADTLWQIYTNEEDFANGVLSIVHQFNYVVTTPGEYPVETMVDNKGDCDLFSFVAASIMVAGGLDVVLLYYEQETHMNIGVHLSNPPEKTRWGVYKITNNDIPYYTAEATGGNWTTGWRVGELPDNLKQAKTQVITLEDAEQVAPGQVSAAFTTLEPSEVSLEISSPFAFERSTVTLTGQLTPKEPDKNVTIYLGITGYPWSILGTAVTRSDGSFSYVWKTADAGVYALRASWSGDSTFAGATSATQVGTVIPIFLAVLIGLVVVAIIVGIVAVAASRHTHPGNLEPKEPQPPTFFQV